MDINEAIKNRRSIRKYKPDLLTKEQIIEILDAGNRAPSAKNRVQWRFHVFQGNAKKELVNICRTRIKELPEIPLMRSASNSFKIMDEAPVVIVVTMKAEWGGISPEIQSVSAAIQNMLLKAHSMGIGSLWIGDVLFATPAILEYLGYKEEHSEIREMLKNFGKQVKITIGESDPLIAALTFGYPAEEPSREPKMKIEEITKWYE